MTDRLLTVAEVAERLRLSHATVRRMAKEHRITFIRPLGGHLRFPEDAIEEYLQAARVEAVRR